MKDLTLDLNCAQDKNFLCSFLLSKTNDNVWMAKVLYSHNNRFLQLPNTIVRSSDVYHIIDNDILGKGGDGQVFSIMKSFWMHLLWLHLRLKIYRMICILL